MVKNICLEFGILGLEFYFYNLLAVWSGANHKTEPNKERKNNNNKDTLGILNQRDLIQGIYQSSNVNV